MELRFDGNTSVEVSGTVETGWPRYMRMLPNDEIAEAMTAEQRRKMVLCAGRHPDGSIVFVTCAGNIREITFETCTNYGIPDGDVVPADHGHTLLIEDALYEVAVDWAIENSRSLVGYST